MSDLKLPTGQYFIRNGETFAGRNHVEDRTGRPKKVTCPTDGPDDPESFLIQQLDNGRYRIEARGAPTGVLHGLLFAFLQDDIHKPEEWIITLQELSQQYTIVKANKTDGWIKHEREHHHHQIAVRPLKVGHSFPPFYPPNELWHIEPLED